tara:strand:+ start:56 stop:706 length:651 start_codon:yes stop_codon:yes gene_type:complete
MAKDTSAFDFGNYLNQLGVQASPYVTQANRFIYGMAPQTAAKAAGYTGKGVLTPAMLQRGAMGVSTLGARRFPLVAGGLQFLGGDPIGGIGTAGGGFAGAKLGAKLGMAGGPPGMLAGALIGGAIGGGLGQGLTRSVTGIDVNNPLTGPDISLGPIPLTPYAKTKKGVKRAAELEALRLKEMLPIMEKARQQQFQRDLIGSQVQMAGQLLGNIYPR